MKNTLLMGEKKSKEGTFLYTERFKISYSPFFITESENTLCWKRYHKNRNPLGLDQGVLNLEKGKE